MIWIYIILMISVLYYLLIFIYIWHWRNLAARECDLAIPEGKELLVTVLIIGRNESAYLEACLESICNNTFPAENYEIIYIDDHSEDHSIDILSQLSISNLRVFELKALLQNRKVNSYKKEALKFGVDLAVGELIVQTDADSIVGEEWIKNHWSSYKSGSAFSAAPVLSKNTRAYLVNFQYYDFITTMGITGAGINSGMHFMANGANMSYTKKVFQKHFESLVLEKASGDDMFLVQAVAKDNRSSVTFLKNHAAVVFTRPETHIWDFLKQRRRWAAKSTSYKNPTIMIIAALVFTMNLSLLLNLLFGILYPDMLFLFFAQVVAKFILDHQFVRKVSEDLGVSFNTMDFTKSFILYPVYIILIGIVSFIPGPIDWKGRKVN